MTFYIYLQFVVSVLNEILLVIGIEDKLVSTAGYGIVITDEASSFFQDIKGQDNRNESNIGLMNQLFDGRGDKTSLAQLRQRYVPIKFDVHVFRSTAPAVLQSLDSYRKNSVDGQWFCGAFPVYNSKAFQVKEIILLWMNYYFYSVKYSIEIYTMFIIYICL